ncbi:MAG TPA: right-handed parallel beta-helix repeat-containing protein [Chitinophagaceae bacterium]
MYKQILTLLFLSFAFLTTGAQELALKSGLVIKRSAKVKRATYRLDAPAALSKSVIIIEGNNVVVDFNGAVLAGSNSKKAPDEFFGVAIHVRNGKNITLKNLIAKGYKVAIYATGVEGLTIEGCDFSYNYRQRLASTPEKEDLSDWMSYHRNEADQWLRYGAALYLRNCDRATIKGTIVTGGQNGLMLMECDSALIYNNDFSFNSGIGIGMYRSSHNKVLYNKINFNVRGYSHGVYQRGQDSAGILVYEQSSHNLFYKNSATHSGDGFFLWAGQTTMDTGEGGSNDNVLLENDFSYAPTNGIEVTFSRNRITHNRIYECTHGIWGGYSYGSVINDNQFRNNRIAIAIEHGQSNTIHHNLFLGDKEAIRLWGRDRQPADWGYAKKRSTGSKGYQIVSNSFNNHPIGLNLSRTDSIVVFENRISNCDTVFKLDSTVTGLDTAVNDQLVLQLSEDIPTEIPDIQDPQDPFRGGGRLAGRRQIRMTEWGPYDFRYPLIWNTNPTDTSGSMEFEVLGPRGKWRILSVKGLDSLSKRADSTSSRFSAQRMDSPRIDIEIVAEYTGAAFIDQFGNKITAGKPHRFSFRKFFQPIAFSVAWYPLDSMTNPIRDTSNKLVALKTPPFKTEEVNKLSYAWWGGIKTDSARYEQFVTIASGFTQVPQGTYELGMTWDDAVRVYVDNKRVVNEWNPSKHSFDESPHKRVRLQLGGRHHIRVEHVNLGGFAVLDLKLNRVY